MMQPVHSFLRRRLFHPPSIPGRLIGLVLILIVTQVCTLLMNQPIAFWADARYASPNMPFGFLLGRGVWIFLTFAVVYLILVGILLKTLNIRPGFFLACWLFLFHVIPLFWTVNCGPRPYFEFSSESACAVFPFGSVVGFAALFIFILLGILPSAMSRRGKRISWFFAAVWILLMGYGVVHAAFPAPSAWRPIVSLHSPGPRTLAVVAYDVKRQRAVLFGGSTGWVEGSDLLDNSTWEWDGSDWHAMDTPTAPPARMKHGMAYDQERGTVLLFGGKDSYGEPLMDLWEWDGATWRKLCPACNPAARYDHQMFYDTGRNKVVVYGGLNNKPVGFSDAWAWDGSGWSNIPFESSSPAMFNASMIFDTEHYRAISFIPRDWGNTWILEWNTWRRLDPIDQPPPRDESMMVYDPERDLTILFGGEQDGVWFNDTWIFDQKTWTEFIAPGAPPQRDGGVAFYDTARHSVMIYGGRNSGSVYEDMWELVLPGSK